MATSHGSAQRPTAAPLLYRIEGDVTMILIGTRKETMRATIENIQVNHPKLKGRAQDDFRFEVQWKNPKTQALIKAVVATDAWNTIVFNNPDLVEIAVTVRKSAQEEEKKAVAKPKVGKKRPAVAMSPEYDNSEDEEEDYVGPTTKSTKTFHGAARASANTSRQPKVAPARVKQVPASPVVSTFGYYGKVVAKSRANQVCKTEEF